MKPRINLRRLLFIILSTMFVALLIELTGEFSWLWPLYGIPVIVASLTYYAAGAVVMTAVTAALLSIHTLSANISVTTEFVVGSAIGVAMFLTVGLVAGILIQKQELHSQELERISVYDPLTGLYSTSYFMTRLEEEVQRRARYGGDITLLLFELDDFKSFTDTFGSHRGNLLLEHLTEVLKISVRETDVLARYNERAFALICPHYERDEMLILNKRLKELVAETEFEGDELEPVTRHTMSIGISTYPDSAGDAKELLERAESALLLQMAEASKSSHPVAVSAESALESGT